MNGMKNGGFMSQFCIQAWFSLSGTKSRSAYRSVDQVPLYTCGIVGYTSVYPHCLVSFEPLYVRDHRTAAQCVTSLTRSDHQIASGAVVRLPEWLSHNRSATRGVTPRCSLYVWKCSRLTFTLHNYSLSLFPLHWSTGITDALDFSIHVQNREIISLFGFPGW